MASGAGRPVELGEIAPDDGELRGSWDTSQVPVDERPARVRELQERAARAVPAAVQENTVGTWLRHTDSPTTWWAGAALMHGAACDVPSAIDAAEQFYKGHDAPARFQICPACPPELDGALSHRNYGRSGDVSLQVAGAGEIAGRLPVSALPVDVAQQPDRAWCQVLAAAQEPAADPDRELILLQRVDPPSVYATARLAGRPVAVGRAVADTGWTGVFAMATLPYARRQGAAVAVLATLAQWAIARHSGNVYLQVTGDSTTALRLYARAGFEELCTYHYRTAQGPR